MELNDQAKTSATAVDKTQEPIIYPQAPIIQPSISQQQYDQQHLTLLPSTSSYPVQPQMPVMVRQGAVLTGTTQHPLVKSDAWSTSLFDCSKSNDCCYAHFCLLCYLGNVYQKFEPIPCGCCCCYIPHRLRPYFRGRHGIKGTLSEDELAFCCCPCCALIQLNEEIKKRGV